jgi:FkbM family methyltransferase
MPPTRLEVLCGLDWLVAHEIEVATVIDVGASDGRWSKECRQVLVDAHYLLFDPDPAQSSDLDQFVEEHSRSRADKRAVGPANGMIRFDASTLFGGGLDFEGSKPGSIEVPMVTLDSAVQESGMPGPYLIKLDTHGFEKGILEGASNTLRETTALVVECYNFRIEPTALLFWEFCGYMVSKGFRPVRMVDVSNRKLDGALWQMDMFFIRSDWKGFEDLHYR